MVGRRGCAAVWRQLVSLVRCALVPMLIELPLKNGYSTTNIKYIFCLDSAADLDRLIPMLAMPLCSARISRPDHRCRPFAGRPDHPYAPCVEPHALPAKVGLPRSPNPRIERSDLQPTQRASREATKPKNSNSGGRRWPQVAGSGLRGAPRGPSRKDCPSGRT